jgi:hypothetical protein
MKDNQPSSNFFFLILFLNLVEVKAYYQISFLLIMPNFVIAYHGWIKSDHPEVEVENREKWQAWLDNLGDAVINPGTPLKNSKTVTSEGITDTDVSTFLTGFTTIKAENMDKALEIAKECPFLEVGTLEIAEIMEM